MNDEVYKIDHSHPIPDLGVIDINTVKKGGGSDLFIVVADPLQGDRRSLERLLRKVEVYLEFIKTDQFRRESGVATSKNTKIIVKINANSDHSAFDLLERNQQWVKNNNATLVIDTNL